MPRDEFGDFQTPLELARQCLRVVGLPADARVLEPTCGVGGFLRAAAELVPGTERVGVEIQPGYAAAASDWGRVVQGDVFQTDLRDTRWRSTGPLRVIGNPPWVTSADLTRMDAANVPVKSNAAGAQGLEALLGSSNFDVGEYIIVKCLTELRDEPFELVMLCKTQVARAVIMHAAAAELPVASARLYRIDAKKWFGAMVDACLFVVVSDPMQKPEYTVAVHDDLFEPDAAPTGRFGIVAGRMVADVDAYARMQGADGVSALEWRSGVKHDAARVFEVPADADVGIEPEHLYPLLKGTDLFRGRAPHRQVILPQTTLGADTATLSDAAPQLWAYLTAHGEALDARRSSIYRGRPRFSVFGIGAYTFAPYKVAVSGLHKKAVFRLLGPIGGRPVVLDDTCYFVPFDDPAAAAITAAMLTSAPAQALIDSLVFWDAKRPITKRLLSRLDLGRLALDEAEILDSARRIAAEAGVPFDESDAAAC